MCRGWLPSQPEALAPEEPGHQSPQQHFRTSPRPPSLPTACCQSVWSILHCTHSVPLNIPTSELLPQNTHSFPVPPSWPHPPQPGSSSTRCPQTQPGFPRKRTPAAQCFPVYLGWLAPRMLPLTWIEAPCPQGVSCGLDSRTVTSVPWPRAPPHL